MSKSYPKIEEDILKFWDENKIFEKSLEKESPKGDYVFYDGPPFATGLPHYGHILGSTVKDVVGRYWTMKGYHVDRRWGWDCHGLPIENIVEKKLGINSKKEIEKIGIEKFNQTCRSQVLTYVNEWGKTIHRMARWVDFENSYKTMDNSYIESVWWAFKTIYDKGLLYEGKKVLLNCPRCETPISKAEVAMDNSYKEVTEDSIYVKFLVKGEDNIYFLAWTTTPWTLPGNVALAVGKDIEYVKVKVGEEFLILAKDRMNILDGQYEVVEEMKGNKLVGLGYEPLYEIEEIQKGGGPVFRIAEADFVSTEEGTGIVHTAVVYGEDDYNLGMKLGLPLVPLLNDKAVFGTLVPEFLQGAYFKDADALVTKDLVSRNLIYKVEPNTHAYPHCHRCETPLFYNAIAAWFLNIQKIKPKLLKLNEKISWFPKHFKHGRFQKSVEGAPDWNISRNRYWAAGIPVWKCTSKKCKGIQVIGSVEELRQNAISIPEGEIDLHKHVIDDIFLKCQKCGGQMKRVSEVIDSWFEAGSMPYAAVHYPFENKEWFEKNFPAQFISEYTGQIRTWFYYMLVMSACLFDDISFENVVVTGVVRAEDGSKMSKRLQNYPAPEKIFENYGVDSMRYYLMASPVMKAEDMNFSEKEVLEVYRNVVMLTLNVLSFYKTYEKQKNRETEEQRNRRTEKQKNRESAVHILDQWIMARLNEFISEATKQMDAYDISRATRLVEKFMNDLSTWYLRRSRDRFKQGDEAGIQTFGYVLGEFSKVIAPIVPFLAEHVYQEITNHKQQMAKSVHLQNWPSFPEALADKPDVLEKMDVTRKIVELGLAARAEAKIKVRQPLAKLQIANSKLQSEYIDLIKDEVNVKEVLFEKGDELKVFLDTNITPELQLEGDCRELIRQINTLRKNKGLTINDKIKILYDGDIKAVVEKFGPEITKATIADAIEEGAGETEVQINKRTARLSIIQI